MQSTASPHALKQSHTVHETLIKKHGTEVSIFDYMAFCLSDPQFGYYRHQNPLGKTGDFITAPEISQVFGELIGIWLVNLYEQMGCPSTIHVIELGPGRGLLMRDCLRAFRIQPDLKKALSLHMVEIHDGLKSVQKKACAPLAVTHHDDINACLTTIGNAPILVIANEFFDALPIKQFEYTGQDWYERSVNISDMPSFSTQKKAVELSKLVSDIGALLPLTPPKSGDIFEYNPITATIMKDITKHVKDHGGGGLIIDYGYLKPVFKDTFQALKNHQFTSPLHQPGACDLTAHVNFHHVTTVAQNADLTTHLTTQHDFLMSMGIHERTKALTNLASSPQQKIDIYSATNRLIDASEMGTLFKVLQFWRLP